MAFCEQCGAKLTPESRFCEECGAAVEFIAEASSSKEGAAIQCGLKEIFLTRNWKDEWAQAAVDANDSELGLILTREEALLLQVDAGPVQLQELIDDYINKAAKRGVKYFYLNLDKFPGYDGEGDVDSVVSVMREVVDVARPKYVFILGNDDVVDVACWENEAEDGDDEVDSDLCYSTLDTESPWEGQEYDFDEVLRVGRLPTYSGEGFEKFKAYFDTAATHIGRMDRIVPYGLSALVWEKESNYEFGKTASRKVDASPAVDYSNVGSRIGSEANLLFFNLHGSNRAKYWYGQDGGDYPEAVAPSVLSKIKRPYFLGVEACYGARYLDGLTPEDSIVLTAMQNNCIVFLGSSKIAFGTSSPSGSCADLVVGSFVKCISKGESAGDAHIAGLERLTEDWGALDDADIKTMAEFALYGDPSARTGANSSLKGFKSLLSGSKVCKGLSVPMPDVGRAVHAVGVEIDAKIEAIIDEYVSNEVLPELAGTINSKNVSSKTLKMSKTGLNQKIYAFKSGALNRVAKVYFDDNGRIRKTLVSK